MATYEEAMGLSEPQPAGGPLEGGTVQDRLSVLSNRMRGDKAQFEFDAANAQIPSEKVLSEPRKAQHEPPAGEVAARAPATGGASYEEAMGMTPGRTLSGEEFANPPRVAEFEAMLKKANADARPAPSRTTRLAAEAAAIGDFILGVPGMMLGTGANLGSTAMGLVTGETPREAWQGGRRIAQQVSELPLVRGAYNPLQKMLQTFPEFQRAYEESLTTGALDKVMGIVEKAGEHVEEKTGGRVLKEQVQTAFDTLLTGAAGRGAGVASRPKPLYQQVTGEGVRITDPKQLFPDDAAHAAWEAEWGKTPGTALAPYRAPRSVEGEVVRPGTREWAASDIAKAAGLGAGAVGLSQLDQDEAAGALAVAGGIKAKGGMWHPEAVRRLAEAIVPNRVLDPTITPEGPKGLQNWAPKAVQTYLNRHAGIEGDPLKDIVLPSGKTWEEVTDTLIRSEPIKNAPVGWAQDIPVYKQVELMRTHGEEPIWDVRTSRFNEETLGSPELTASREAMGEVRNYLSHVGDYLRQNVSPEKLPQYDLVRAVKETAKNDERVAKEMEKSRSASTAQLPIYKDYPGSGMKWVELAVPEKLSEEQAKGVRRLTPQELREWAKDVGDPTDPGVGRANRYVAVDQKGKPINNAYTDTPAVGRTPELAWGAGRLAEEGNTMGHCFPPGTLVNALVPTAIEQLAVGAAVVTHTGDLRRVTELFVREYKGDLVTVITRGGSPFECTPEHPLLVLRPVSTGSIWQDRYVERRLPETLVPTWLPTLELQAGDYLLSPGLQRPVTPPTHVNLAWLCGVYAGDGDPGGGAGVNLTCNRKDDVLRIVETFAELGYEAKVKWASNFCRIRANSKELSAKFRAWFGDTSETKHLPAFLFGPDSDLQATLDGLMMADGTYYEGRCRLMSTSFVLMQQAWLIAVTLGYRPSIKPYRRVSGYANASPAWTVEWQEHEGKWHANRRWNTFYATQVTELTTRRYSGPVYNLEVEGDHSYLVNGLAVHNCVGGYCEGVASGESKIYSLRDAKGESHVTVEVQPKGASYVDEAGTAPGYAVEADNILQIKGKQNRAPATKYLPFVQDFVRVGKWGEVGDLQGTGLSHVPKNARFGTEQLSPQEAGLVPDSYHTQTEIEAAHNRGVPFEKLQRVIEDKHPAVEVTLQEHPNGTIELADFGRKAGIEEVPGATGALGAGQRALADITSWADANNRGMMLMAQPNRGSTMPLPKLVEIYERAGFHPGEEQPYNDAVMMYRSPNAETVSPSLTEGTQRGTDAIRPAGAEGAMGQGGEGEGGAPPQAGRQAGRADPRFLTAIATAGLGGLVGAQIMEDHTLRGALIGAMSGMALPYFGRAAKAVAVGADPLLGLVSTRLANESPSIAMRARRAEQDLLVGTAKYITQASDFLKALRRYDDPELNRAIISNDRDAIKEALLRSGQPALVQGWMAARGVLREIGGQLVETGKLGELLEGYFPRIVKDRAGLLDYLGGELKTELQKRINEGNLAKAKDGGLTPAEESSIINRYLQEQRRGGKPGFLKGRSIAEVDMQMADFYHKPWEAFPMYVEAAVADIAKTRFFGKDAVKGEKGLDVDASIGAIVARELQSGKINYEQAETIRNLLQARYMPEKSGLPDGARTALQGAKALAYAGLLGNVASAAVQIGDTFLSVYAQGLIPATAAITRKLTGRADITAKSLGIDEVATDFVGKGMPEKILKFGLKYSGFSLIDRFGKDVLVDATRIKAERAAQTPAGRAELARKYGESFGDEFPKLLDDLQARRRTDTTDAMLFSELSDMQPINRLEVPEMYLRNPNGRNLYMLHLFMLKQADVLRRDAYNEIKAGNVARGTGNLLKYAMVLTISGVPSTLVKDWLDNKPMGDSLLGYVDNVFKTFGWSSYVADQFRQGHPIAALLKAAVPPYEMFEDIVTMKPKALRYIPLLGRPLYAHLFDKEEYKKEEAAIAKRDRQVRDALEGSKKLREGYK